MNLWEDGVEFKCFEIQVISEAIAFKVSWTQTHVLWNSTHGKVNRIETQLISNSILLRLNIGLQFHWFEIQLAWDAIGFSSSGCSSDLVVKCFEIQFKLLEIQLRWKSTDLRFCFDWQEIWGSIGFRFNWLEIQPLWDSNDSRIFEIQLVSGSVALESQLAWDSIRCNSSGLKVNWFESWDSVDRRCNEWIHNSTSEIWNSFWNEFKHFDFRIALAFLRHFPEKWHAWPQNCNMFPALSQPLYLPHEKHPELRNPKCSRSLML